MGLGGSFTQFWSIFAFNCNVTFDFFIRSLTKVFKTRKYVNNLLCKRTANWLNLSAKHFIFTPVFVLNKMSLLVTMYMEQFTLFNTLSKADMKFRDFAVTAR